jgi:hypothetical protein
MVVDVKVFKELNIKHQSDLNRALLQAQLQQQGLWSSTTISWATI